MPQRKKAGASNIVDNNDGGTVSTPPPAVSTTARPELSPVGPTDFEHLSHQAHIYVGMHQNAKEASEEKEKCGDAIKGILAIHPEYLSQVGDHREVVVNFSGLAEYMIRLQKSVRVRYTDDAIQWLRNKLGQDAERFVIQREELAEGALAILLQEGKIDNNDVARLTDVKETESLIVKSTGKAVKKKSRP